MRREGWRVSAPVQSRLESPLSVILYRCRSVNTRTSLSPRQSPELEISVESILGYYSDPVGASARECY